MRIMAVGPDGDVLIMPVVLVVLVVVWLVLKVLVLKVWVWHKVFTALSSNNSANNVAPEIDSGRLIVRRNVVERNGLKEAVLK